MPEGVPNSAEPTDPKLLRIWWLLPSEIHQLLGVGDSAVDLLGRLRVPLYIAEQVRSAGGRAGRGRLWVPSNIHITGIEWPSIENAGSVRAGECAGIVIWACDAKAMAGLPGLLTNTNFSWWAFA